MSSVLLGLVASRAVGVSSAFSAVTVILARAILKEPISPIQFLGMILIFGGVAGLADL
jgi:drug/metabolite transporter (DMT)-like permease